MIGKSLKALCLAALLWPSAAEAAADGPVCAPAAEAARALGGHPYNEELVAWGVAKPDGALMEIWAGPKSWTLVLHTRRGFRCLIASGEGWRQVPRTKGHRQRITEDPIEGVPWRMIKKISMAY